MKNKAMLIPLIAGVVVLLSCSDNRNTNKTSKMNEDSIKSMILAKEQATLDRWYHGDPLGFIDNSWEDVTYFDASIRARADGIEAFKNILTPIIGKVHVPTHKFDKPFVQLFGDIAILTFTDVFDVKENTARWHATEIYQRRGNEWKLIHSHWTQSNVK
jgi:hypothetical protein